MNDISSSILHLFDDGRVKLRELLNSYVNLDITTTAEYFIQVNTIDELTDFAQKAISLDIPVYIIGSGSGIKKFPKFVKGLVIKNNCRQFRSMGMRGNIRNAKMGVEDILLYAESGTIVNQLVRYTIDEGLEGMEYQLGLPGTVGGAIATNAKYIPKYIPVSSIIHSIKILHSDGSIATYTKELPYFLLNKSYWEKTTDIILTVIFRLFPSDKEKLWERANEASQVRLTQTNIYAQ